MSTRPPKAAQLVLGGELVSALGTGLTLPFLLIYLHQLRGLPVALVGAAISWTGLVALATTPVMGALIDRLGARRVLVGSLLVQGGGTAALSGVHSAGQAFAVLAVMAGGGSGTWPAAAALLGGLVPDAQRPRLFALQFTMLNLGIGLGGLVGGLLVDVHDAGSFRTVYYLDGVSSALFALVLLRVPNRRPDQPEPTDDEERGGYRQVLADRAMRRICLLMLLVVLVGYGQVEAGFPAFATEEAGVSTRVIGFAFAANTGLIVAAQLVVLKHLEGRSRSRALAVVGLVWAVSWTVFGAAALTGGLAAGVLVVASMGLFGLGETLMSPSGPAIVNALAPDHLRGRYNATNSLMWALGQVLGPVTGGLLLGSGHAGLWVALLVTGCLGTALLALDLRRHLSPEADGRSRAAAPLGASAVGHPDPLGGPR